MTDTKLIKMELKQLIEAHRAFRKALRTMPDFDELITQECPMCGGDEDKQAEFGYDQCICLNWGRILRKEFTEDHSEIIGLLTDLNENVWRTRKELEMNDKRVRDILSTVKYATVIEPKEETQQKE